MAGCNRSIAALMAGGMVAATRSAVKSIGGGAAALMGKGRGASGSGSGMSSGGGKTPGGSGNGGAGNVPGRPTGGNPEMKNDHAPTSGEKGSLESGDKQGGDKTGKSRAPNWAKQALHALHTPEEARPSGGSVTPRL